MLDTAIVVRAPWLGSALVHRASLAPVRASLSSLLLADAPDALADSAAASGDATPYIAIYVLLVLALVGGVGYLVYQDLEAGRRKREAVESRGQMAEKLRAQGMEREARILDMEREQLQEQIESAKARPIWEQAAQPGRDRKEAALRRSEEAASSSNRDARRMAAREQRLQERKANKAKKKAPPAPPSA